MIRPLALLAGLAATEAAALAVDPCGETTPVDAFRAAQASSEAFVVLLGSLDFDGLLLPILSNVPSGPVPARFEGVVLDEAGLTTPFATALTLRTSCDGLFCGRIEPGGPFVVFARVVPGGYEVEVDSCTTSTFRDFEFADTYDLIACFRDGC